MSPGGGGTLPRWLAHLAVSLVLLLAGGLLLSEFISGSFHNLGDFKQYICLLTVLEARNQKSQCLQGRASSERSRGAVPCLSPGFCCCHPSLALLTLDTHHSNFCFCFHMCSALCAVSVPFFFFKQRDNV